MTVATKRKRRARYGTVKCSTCGMIGSWHGSRIEWMSASGWRLRKNDGTPSITCPMCRRFHLLDTRPGLSEDECTIRAFAGK